jgi:coatomer subunit gamma
VEAMLQIIEVVPDAKETGLDHCCEFIEDCEFPELSIKVNSTSCPSVACCS